MDAYTNIGSGVSSVIEGVLDIGAYCLSWFQDKLGFKEASDKTKKWAETDTSSALFNYAANKSPLGKVMYMNYLINKEGLTYEEAEEAYNNLTIEDLTSDETIIEKYSVFGEKTDNLIHTTGYVAGMAMGGYALGGAGNITVSLGNHVLKLPILAGTGGMASGMNEASLKGGSWGEIFAKGFTGGTIEMFTEAMFGFMGIGGNDITEGLIRNVTNKIASPLGKRLVQMGIQGFGEGTEEFVSYLFNHIVDNHIIDKLGDADFSHEWDWKEVWDEFIVAYLSTLMTGGASIVINQNNVTREAEKQLGRELTQDEKRAVTQMAINHETGADVFYETETENGVITDITEVTGKAIKNPNEKLNIAPAVVNGLNGTYHVIDAYTGALLDDTNYSSPKQAERGFTERIQNADEQSIADINKGLLEVNTALQNKTTDTVSKLVEKLKNIPQNQSNMKALATSEQIENEIKNEIQNEDNPYEELYRKRAEINEQINELSSKENLTNREQKKIAKLKTKLNQTENDIKLMRSQERLSQAYDTVSREQAPLRNAKEENTNTPGTKQGNTDTNTEVYIQEMAANFQDDLTYATIADNYRSTKGQTTKELAEIREETGASFEEISEVLDDITNGVENNTELAQVVREKLDSALSNGYKNIYGQTVMQNEDYRRITGQTTAEAAESETTSFDEDMRIFGIEEEGKVANNENTMYNNNESESVLNGGEREQTTQDNGQTTSRVQKGKNTEGESRNERVHGEVEESQSQSIRDYQKQQQKKHGKGFRATAVSEENQTELEKSVRKGIKETTGLDLGIFETNQETTEGAFYQDNNLFVKHDEKGTKKNTNFKAWHEIGHWFKQNKPSSWNKIYNIIDETVTKKQIDDYINILNDKSVLDNMTDEQKREFIVEEIVSDYFGNWANDAQNWKNYVDVMTPEYQNLVADITLENEKYYFNVFGTVEQQEQVYSAITDIMQDFIGKDNSQTTTYSNTETTKQVTQANTDETSGTSPPDSNIKNSDRSDIEDVDNTNDIMYDENGIELNSEEENHLWHAINTDNTNMKNGINDKLYGDYYYVFNKQGYGNYNYIARIKIEGNEELIKKLERGINNGIIRRTTKAIRSLKEYARYVRGLNNSNNDSSKETRTNERTNRLYNRNVGQRNETRQRQNSQESVGNKSGEITKNSSESSFSLPENTNGGLTKRNTNTSASRSSQKVETSNLSNETASNMSQNKKMNTSQNNGTNSMKKNGGLTKTNNTAPTSNEDIRFSDRKDLNEGLTEQEQKEYSDTAKNNIQNVRKQLNDWINMKLEADDDIKMGNTPSSLLIPTVNIKNLPIDMELDVLVKATGGKHSISLDEIAKIPRRIRKSYINNEWF